MEHLRNLVIILRKERPSKEQKMSLAETGMTAMKISGMHGKYHCQMAVATLSADGVRQ